MDRYSCPTYQNTSKRMYGPIFKKIVNGNMNK